LNGNCVDGTGTAACGTGGESCASCGDNPTDPCEVGACNASRDCVFAQRSCTNCCYSLPPYSGCVPEGDACP
jgi:hypothetical protein